MRKLILAFVLLSGPALAQVYSSPTFQDVLVNGGLVAGAAASGNRGAGTINAQAVYVNGIAVSTGLSSGINLGSYGAALNGTTDDSAAYAAAYAAAPNNGTIYIPAGAKQKGSYTDTAGKSVLWQALGTFDYGTSASGTNPVISLGDGDVLAGFYAGRYNLSKTLTTSSNSFTILDLSLTNNDPSITAGHTPSAMVVNGTSGPNAGGGTWPLIVNLASGATGGSSNGDVGIYSKVTRTGAAESWQFVGQTIDQTGVAPNSPSADVGVELDINANGPEAASTLYAPGTGARAFLNLFAWAYSSAWQANHAYKVGAAVTPGNGFTYTVKTAGTSGATPPTWPTGTGSTVTDGTVTWQYGTTANEQVSVGVDVGGDSTAELGTGYFAKGAFYNAVADFSNATLDTTTNPKAAGIRLASKMPIDFSADGTAANQNYRTLGFYPVAGSLQYQVNGVAQFTIGDSGNVAVGSTLILNTVGGPAVKVQGSPAVGFDTSAGTPTTAYRLGKGQCVAFDTNTPMQVCERASDGKLVIQSNGTAVASIDSSGNMILKGTLTQSGTP